MRLYPLSLGNFVRDRSGNVAMFFALVMVPLLLFAGLAVDYSRTLTARNRAQDALDSAVLAAARAPAATREAQAAAYFKANTQGVIGTASTPSFQFNTDGSVSASDTVNVKTLFGGLAGITQLGGQVATRAVRGGGTTYCVLALAKSGATGITTNGAPKANLGCNIMSNTDATCHGHNLGAPIGSAHGTNDGCGVSEVSNVDVIADPYDGIAANLPSNTCSSYPAIPSKKGTALPASNQWSGSYTLSGYFIVCGDQQLTGDTTINAPSGAVLVIENGVLDLNGYTLQATAGSGLTIVFSGSNSASYKHILTGSGTLNFAAPTSGVWSGIAIYQDPALTTNVDISAAGNSPTWNITGLVYLPHATVTLSGAINKSSQGASCLAMVIDNITVNGTGAIFDNNTGCAQAGLKLPSNETDLRIAN